MRLTLVRHGQTDWNLQGRFQGQCEVPLNERGLAQAREIAAALSGEAFDRAVSSDLARAMQTARIIAPRLEIVPEPRWREFHFGRWEGLTWLEIVERWPEAAAAGATDARNYAPEGGETFEQLRNRVSEALDGLRNAQVANALVVTHAGPLHAVLDTLFGQNSAIARGVRFSPAGITRIRFDAAGPQLELLDGTSHLSPSY